MFSNVGGNNLERYMSDSEKANLTQTFTLSLNGEKTFSGIPINTDYVITETSTSDGSTLAGITNGTGTSAAYDAVNQTISGTISPVASGTPSYEVTADNTLKPVVDITVKKVFQDSQGTAITETSTLPEYVYVKLYRYTGETKSGREQALVIDGVTDTNGVISLSRDYDVSGSDHYYKVIQGLDRWDDYTQQSTRKEYKYYFKEVNADGTAYTGNGNTEITLEAKTYTVTDGQDITITSNTTGNTNNGTGTATITNKLKPDNAGFVLTKVSSENASTTLSDVEFKLYTDSACAEANVVHFSGSSSYTYTTDSTAQDYTDTLKTTSEGTITVSGLPVGTYYLKETKAKDGYNLLTNAITLTLTGNDSDYKAAGTGVSGSSTWNSGTRILSFTVENKPGAKLPTTGGRGVRLFIEIGLMLVAVAGALLIVRRRRVF